MRRAIGYVRVSTEEQADQGLSLVAQRAAVGAYATMRGMELVDLIEERGVSGGVPLASRPGGAQLVAAIAAKSVSAVVAVKLDRLFRDAQDCLAVTRSWDKKNVALHLVDMGGQAVDTSTAMGQFFLLVMSGVAEMERGLVRERTKAALRHKTVHGEKTGGHVPYGYCVHDGRLQRDAKEQAVIADAIRLRGEGWTLGAIAEYLDSSGAPCRGKCWHRASVSRLITHQSLKHRRPA